MLDQVHEVVAETLVSQPSITRSVYRYRRTTTLSVGSGDELVSERTSIVFVTNGHRNASRVVNVTDLGDVVLVNLDINTSRTNGSDGALGLPDTVATIRILDTQTSPRRNMRNIVTIDRDSNSGNRRNAGIRKFRRAIRIGNSTKLNVEHLRNTVRVVVYDMDDTVAIDSRR